MKKHERMQLYELLSSKGMFYGVERGNTKGKQSACKGCNALMAKGGNLRFRHLVCSTKCAAPKINNDTCGRWHPECLVAMQESDLDRFVLTNPGFKPIKESWQLAGFEDLTPVEQELILRVLDGKTGVVTKRRLVKSGLTRKLSFGTPPSDSLSDPRPKTIPKLILKKEKIKAPIRNPPGQRVTNPSAGKVLPKSPSKSEKLTKSSLIELNASALSPIKSATRRSPPRSPSTSKSPEKAIAPESSQPKAVVDELERSNAPGSEVNSKKRAGSPVRSSEKKLK